MQIESEEQEAERFAAVRMRAQQEAMEAEAAAQQALETGHEEVGCSSRMLLLCGMSLDMAMVEPPCCVHSG